MTRFGRRLLSSRGGQYAAAVLFVACALGIAALFKAAPVSLFLCAITAATWVGGVPTGLVAGVLSHIAFAMSLPGLDPGHRTGTALILRHVFFAGATTFVLVMGGAQRRATATLERALKRVRLLSRRMFRAQDDERQRIARMLHDTTAQDLAALKMQLARLKRTSRGLSEQDRAIVEESLCLADGVMQAVRTLSYLLHPACLEQLGLPAAVRWYGDGFAQRSGIAVHYDIPGSMPRLPVEIETTLFRVSQEALANIHRHADSSSAAIRITVGSGSVTLDIADEGKGIPPATLKDIVNGASLRGIGIAIMRERVQLLSGHLDIESDQRGTTIRAVLPLPVSA